MTYTQLRDAAFVAMNRVQNAEKHLADLNKKSIVLADQLDAAGEALATAKDERARQPEQAHLTAAVTAATGKFEALTDASELNLHSIEQATRACADAQAALTEAEIALKPAQEKHDQEMQQLWTTSRPRQDPAHVARLNFGESPVATAIRTRA